MTTRMTGQHGTLATLLASLVLGSLGGGTLRAQDLPGGPEVGPAEAFPGQAAYQKNLAEAEAAYVKQIMTARKQYVEAIRDLQMRARMLQAASQAMNAEVKRVESLPTPRVEPEPATPARAEKPLKVSLSLQAPSPLWSLRFSAAQRVGEEVWVLWRLHEKDGMGAMVIVTLTDAAALSPEGLSAGAKVRHFVIGKTWKWGDEESDVKFIPDEKSMPDAWRKGKAIETVTAD